MSAIYPSDYRNFTINYKIAYVGGKYIPMIGFRSKYLPWPIWYSWYYAELKTDGNSTWININTDIDYIDSGKQFSKPIDAIKALDDLEIYIKCKIDVIKNQAQKEEDTIREHNRTSKYKIKRK